MEFLDDHGDGYIALALPLESGFIDYIKYKLILEKIDQLLDRSYLESRLKEIALKDERKKKERHINHQKKLIQNLSQKILLVYIFYKQVRLRYIKIGDCMGNLILFLSPIVGWYLLVLVYRVATKSSWVDSCMVHEMPFKDRQGRGRKRLNLLLHLLLTYCESYY